MQSIWSECTKPLTSNSHSTLKGNIETDVLVIGGGLAGILCAHRLTEAGVQCVVAEAKTVGSGITKNTTAKITAQHGLIYDQLVKNQGASAARGYYDIQSRAIKTYENLQEQYPCDFEKKTAYVYTMNNREKLEKEAAAYRRLGIPMEWKEDSPLPFQTKGLLGMQGQAQFNPLKLLYALAQNLTVYENTFVTEVKDNIALTPKGNIKAKHIVLATHFPLVNVPGLYFVKLYQHRSYVIALENALDVQGMYVDERSDGHSFRNYKGHLLIGGGDHQTGKKGGGWEELRRLAKNAYPKAQERYAWATQDCMSLDGIPYIGVHRKDKQSLYVATGFNKWGMTGSMAAAEVLTEMITTGKSDYEELFSPQRSMMNPQLFLNLLNAVTGMLRFSKRCPHLGCGLVWNRQEHTWDCPCHGSRFDKNGHVIDNPAKRGMHNE